MKLLCWGQEGKKGDASRSAGLCFSGVRGLSSEESRIMASGCWKPNFWWLWALVPALCCELMGQLETWASHCTPNHLPLQQEGYNSTALCMDTCWGSLTIGQRRCCAAAAAYQHRPGQGPTAAGTYISWPHWSKWLQPVPVIKIWFH